MMLHEVPSLGTINCGSKLRALVAHIHSRAQIMRDKGATQLDEDLVTFWEYQLSALDKPSGHPVDGTYFIGESGKLRRMCYQALSSIRMHNDSEEYKTLWKDFCEFLIKDAGGTVEPEPVDPPVDPEVPPVDPEEPPVESSEEPKAAKVDNGISLD